MYFIFADDSRQLKPTRSGMGPIVAIGGIIIPDVSLKSLEADINTLCEETGFPPGEYFKWSPDPKMWMHKKLTEGDRECFFYQVLELASYYNAKALVVMEDTTKRTAILESSNAEEDILQLFLERVNNQLVTIDSEGVVVIARPSGDRKAEDCFINNCGSMLSKGTPYVKYSKIALNVLSTPSRFCRLLQIADIVISCSVALVSGETQNAPNTFSAVKPLLLRNLDLIGGTGFKIHPDLSYANLYHWLLGDTHIKKGNMGHPLPIKNHPYSTDPNIH